MDRKETEKNGKLRLLRVCLNDSYFFCEERSLLCHPNPYPFLS